MKNDRFILKMNIPIVLLSALLCVFFVCRYKVISGTSLILFMVELAIIAFLCLFRRLPDFDYDRKIMRFHVSFMMYRILSSMVTSGEFMESTRRILIYEMIPFILLGMFVRIVRSYQIITYLKNLGIVNIILGLFEYVFKTNIFAGFIDDAARISVHTFGTASYRVRTFFIHPIICSVFLTVIWFVFWFFPIRNKICDIIVKVCLIVCIIGTQARSSWIAFILVNLLILLNTMHAKKITTIKSIVSFAIGTVLIVLVIFVFKSSFREVIDIVINRWIEGMDKNGNAYYNRVHMIGLGLDTFKGSGVINVFLGSGNGYSLALLKAHSIRGWNTAVDNTFVTILLDYGVFGLLFLLYYFVIAIKSLRESSPLCRMAGAGLLTVLLSGMFFDLFNWFTINMIIATLLCFLVYKRNDYVEIFENSNETARNKLGYEQEYSRCISK